MMMALLQQAEPLILGIEHKDKTVLHPLGLVAILVFSLMLIASPRRLALVPVMALLTFVSIAQRVAVFGLDFSFVRLLVVAGVLRIFMRGELRGIRRNRMDTAVMLWALSGIVIHTIGIGTSAALIFKIGRAVEFAGMYFIARVLIRSWDDVATLTRVLAILSVPVALAFMVEKTTGRNPFAFFGGVNEITAIREGRLRCQGAFAHPIVAGSFWALTLPWIVLSWIEGRDRLIATVGIFCSLFIIAASSSSTPVVCVMLGIVGACFFPVRRLMPTIRLGGLLALIGLHFVMKGPVWSLIGRIDIVGGSTGYHRYRLIDQAIYRFEEWALFGTPTTQHWGWGLHDVTNTYLIVGIGGGFLTLLLFIRLLVLGFGISGRMVRAARNLRDRRRGWTVGVIFFVHSICMIVLGYFGQMDTLWFIQLGIAASLGDTLTARSRAKRRARRPGPINPLALRPVLASGGPHDPVRALPEQRPPR
ncbi:MAG: hypothetical protein ACI8QZ_003151 [Chlamydiales bacterium]|jgi:hypothetical protein